MPLSPLEGMVSQHLELLEHLPLLHCFLSPCPVTILQVVSAKWDRGQRLMPIKGPTCLYWPFNLNRVQCSTRWWAGRSQKFSIEFCSKTTSNLVLDNPAASVLLTSSQCHHFYLLYYIFVMSSVFRNISVILHCCLHAFHPSALQFPMLWKSHPNQIIFLFKHFYVMLSFLDCHSQHNIKHHCQVTLSYSMQLLIRTEEEPC